MIGTSLNQYRITASIGAGGMGEVFRARDTRLNRDVAIKVLPKDFVSDADRQRRFEQESKTLAALNHPNILTIHDAGVHDGAPYLVSELLEGQTLREVLGSTATTAFSVRKATDYALQIAHGLAAAHGKGVIHRDLKPENIFITTDGRVKILDFGLAKLRNPSPALRAPSPLGGERDGVRGDAAAIGKDAETILNTTEPGMVLGTPAYMAPEQVRGEPADHRADIFAFGCVLYEMLSGTRAFRRDTAVESMSAVLNEEPPELSAMNANVPLAIERVVRRCLEKNPNNRFQSAKDLAFAVENAGAASTANFAASSPPPLSKRLVPAILWALAAILVLICVLLLFRKRAVVNTAQRPVPIRISLPSSERIAFPDPVPMLAISSDGSHLAYCVKRGQDSVLFVRPLLSLTQSKALELPETEGATAPFFSPDGRWIGFGQKGALRKITVDGTVSEDLCSLRSAFLVSGFWATDGYLYFADNYSPLSRISERGGSPEVVTQLDAKLGDVGHMFPEVLPGSKALVYGLFRMDAASNDDYWLAVARLGEKQPPKVLFKGNCPHYLAPGYLVFLRLGSLYAVAFDAERLQPLGEPVPLIQIGSFFPPLGDANLSISANGDLAYVPTANPGWSLDFVDASSGMTESIKTGRYYDTPQFSGDGRLVLTTVRGSFDQVWICNLAQGTERQLTRGRGDNQNPYWFSNDTTVLYSWNKDGSQSMKLYSKSVTEWEKPPERLFADDGTSTDEYASSRPHDTLLLYERGAPPQRDIWLVDLLEKQKPKPLIADPKFDEWMASFSPDGTLIAYLSNETGIQEAWVRSLDSSASAIMVSSGGASSPVWSPSGSELFFLAQTNMLSARILARPTLRSEKARVLFPVPTPMFKRRFDISPDGKRFVVVRGGSATSDEVTVIMNWLEELKKRVPLKGTGSE